MRREVSLEEISDGRLYELNDMVKADCQDCAGCHDCCEGMGDSVVLDPMDVYRLCTNLGKTPQELVSTGLIQFDAMDGNILPHLCMSGKKQCCVFLSEQGRCSIHDFRPGFCRLFPLGRFYENGGFKYETIQEVNEYVGTNHFDYRILRYCVKQNKGKYQEIVAYFNPSYYDFEINNMDEYEVIYNDHESRTYLAPISMKIFGLKR